jgi:hypothetical protein
MSGVVAGTEVACGGGGGGDAAAGTIVDLQVMAHHTEMFARSKILTPTSALAEEEHTTNTISNTTRSSDAIN